MMEHITTLSNLQSCHQKDVAHAISDRSCSDGQSPSKVTDNIDCPKYGFIEDDLSEYLDDLAPPDDFHLGEDVFFGETLQDDMRHAENNNVRRVSLVEDCIDLMRVQAKQPSPLPITLGPKPAVPSVISWSTPTSPQNVHEEPNKRNEEWGEITLNSVNTCSWKAAQPLVHERELPRTIPLPVQNPNALLSRSASTSTISTSSRDQTRTKKSWQEISAEVCQFAQENRKNTGLESPAKNETSVDEVMLQFSLRDPVAFRKAKGALQRSTDSQAKLQQWDKKMGLKRCHSRTMTKSSLSRKKLLRSMQEMKKHEKKMRHAASVADCSHGHGSIY